MKKLLAAILTLALLTSLALCAASAEEELTVQDTTPAFMTPSVFAEYFNGMMNALADEYADNLGEEGVEIVKTSYVLTQEDVPDGSIVYYGNNDWSLETSFLFGDQVDYYMGYPALIVNLSIKTGTPESAVYLAKTAMAMVIGYHLQGSVGIKDLTKWFDTVNDPSDVFQLSAGYTLNYIATDAYVQYAVLPPDEINPYVDSAE